MTCVIDVRVYLGFARVGGVEAFRVDVGELGVDPLGGSGLDHTGWVWTEVSQWVESAVTVRKGGGQSDGPLFRAEGGRASFTLTNLDGRFDPLNASGPYSGKLKPGLPVKITGTADGDTHVLFVGRADAWPTGHVNDWWSDVSVAASDDVAALQAAQRGPTALPLAAQNTDDRCHAILDHVAWPTALRAVESTTAMDWEQQSTDLGQSTWAELLLAADSGDAWVWVDRENVIHVERTLPTVPRFYVGNASTPAQIIPARTVEAARDSLARVINRWELAAVGGEVTVLEDRASQIEYGLRQWGRSDLMIHPGWIPLIGPAVWLDKWLDPLTWQPETVTIEPGDGIVASLLAGTDMADLVEVRQVTPDGRTIVERGRVQGTEWTIPPLGGGPAVFTVRLFPDRTPTL